MGVWGIVLCVIALSFVTALNWTPINYTTIFGAADSYFSKNKARSIDAKLARFTKFFAAIFVIIVIALNVLAYFVGKSF